VLAAATWLLYLPSLFGGFILDDNRCLRLLDEYARGQRPSPNMYGFASGGEANRAARQAGWYPWWMSEDLRYRHLRPVSEWFLYAEYRVFGDRALGFRLVGLGLYAVGVLLALAMFRLVGGDEVLARWAALVFAVAAGHVVPVFFISNHCDLVALLLAATAMLSLGRFVRDGRRGLLVLGLAAFILGLSAKESVVPAAVLPLCFGRVFRGQAGAMRRALTATAACTAAGLAWLAYYGLHGYGSNALPILDPLRAPLEYLAALPGRAILLLSTWVIPLNPFLFLLHRDWSKLLWGYGAVGGAALAGLLVMYWRHHRRQKGVVEMAFWPLPFLPLLVCTVPDDRVMMLPGVGLAFLGAAWMTRPRAGAGAGLRAGPFALFVALQVATALVVMGFVGHMETEAQRHLGLMLGGFGRPAQAGDHIFFVNTARDFEALFAQDRLCRMRGNNLVKVSVLADLPRPRVQAVDEYTLRLESEDPPFFSTFAGQMGTSRTQARREGDVVQTDEFEARIVKVRNGLVETVELRFRRPLACDSYRFYWSDPSRPPERVEWQP
jgi:hypothetical protein